MSPAQSTESARSSVTVWLTSRTGSLVMHLVAQLAAAVAATALLAGRPTGSGLAVAGGAAYALAAVAGLFVLIRRMIGRQLRLSGLLSFRILLALAAAAAFDDQAGRGWAWLAAAAVIATALVESPVNLILRRARPVAVQLPGVPPVPEPPFPPAWAVVASTGCVVFGGLLALTGLPGWTYALIAAVPALGLALLGASGLLALRSAAQARSSVRTALQAYGPKFVVFYAGEAGTRYQLSMWLPYLDRLERPYVVITCYPSTVPIIRKLTAAPIVVPWGSRIGGGIEAIVVPSMTTAFYVQGSPLNLGMQRIGRLHHVWLNHGDSDKAANYTHKHQTYDTLMVAGQLGVDRYAAHGVRIPREQFAIVGRPQLERIEIHDEPRPPGPRTVLYAPTWKGGSSVVNYSSLLLGPRLIRALLDRDCTVVFRPHPLSHRNSEEEAVIKEIQRMLRDDAAGTGKRHVYGEQAERVWDIPDCINNTDALISDVSSVTSDYLASGKPFAVVAVRLSEAAFRKQVAIAKAAYVIDRDLASLGTALDAMLGPDPMAEERRAYRSYCLGPRLGPHAPDEFIAVARDIVDGRRKPARLAPRPKAKQ